MSELALIRWQSCLRAWGKSLDVCKGIMLLRSGHPVKTLLPWRGELTDVNLTALKQVREGKKVSLDIMMLMAGCKCNVTVPRRGPATSERVG